MTLEYWLLFAIFELSASLEGCSLEDILASQPPFMVLFISVNETLYVGQIHDFHLFSLFDDLPLFVVESLSYPDFKSALLCQLQASCRAFS